MVLGLRAHLHKLLLNEQAGASGVIAIRLKLYVRLEDVLVRLEKLSVLNVQIYVLLLLLF